LPLGVNVVSLEGVTIEAAFGGRALAQRLEAVRS
jgi:hypothetical protein